MSRQTRAFWAWVLAAAILAAAPLAAASAADAAEVKATATAAHKAPVARKTLDLRPPALSRIFSENQLQAMLSTPDPDEPDTDTETVRVKGTRQQPVHVPSGLLGVPWAIWHPTQSWRLFLPAPSSAPSE